MRKSRDENDDDNVKGEKEKIMDNCTVKNVNSNNNVMTTMASANGGVVFASPQVEIPDYEKDERFCVLSYEQVSFVNVLSSFRS